MEYPSTVQWRFNWECRFQWGYCVFSNGSGVLNGRRFSGNQHEVNGGAASRQLSDFLIRQRREQQPCRPFCICLTRLLIFLSFLPSFLPSFFLSFFLRVVSVSVTVVVFIVEGKPLQCPFIESLLTWPLALESPSRKLECWSNDHNHLLLLLFLLLGSVNYV